MDTFGGVSSTVNITGADVVLLFDVSVAIAVME